MWKNFLQRFLMMSLAGMLFSGTGCTSFSPGRMLNADRVSQTFFDALHRSQNQESYILFSKELAEKISFDQFEQLMGTMKEQWGWLESSETVTMPFHTRAGESGFIPEDIPAQEIQRYVFELQYDRATVNCGLTLIPENQEYKIAWFSFWGSDSAMTPELREKIGELFGE